MWCEFSCFEELFLEIKIKKKFRANSILFKKVLWQTFKTQWVYNSFMWFEELLLNAILCFLNLFGPLANSKKNSLEKVKRLQKQYMKVLVRNIKGT